MWKTVLSLFLLFVYYLYFYYDWTPVVPRPDGPEPRFHKLESLVALSSSPSTLAFYKGPRFKWQVNLDDNHYVSRDGRIHVKGACHGQPDGRRIPARGRALYDYVQRAKMESVAGPQHHFIVHVERVLQEGFPFYFECKDGRIDSLHACAVGQVFEDGNCFQIQKCTYKKDGTSFPEPFDRRFYYTCQDQKMVKHKCPHHHFFFGDSCRSKFDLMPRCHEGDTFKIDVDSYIKCRNGRPRLYKCPPDRMLVGTRCVPNNCAGRANGERVPLPPVTNAALKYSPGYIVCKNERVESVHTCPQHYDRNDSRGDMTIFLPQVFDGQKCAVPEFCANVDPVDPADTIVPVHEFTRHARNWSAGTWFDTAVGYKCSQKRKIRTQLEPGHLIKRYKSEPACSAEIEKVPLSDRYDAYFDCASQSVRTCPPDTFFDTEECRPKIPGAHTYKTVSLMRLDGLNSHQNWMDPWVYSNRDRVECTDPASVYIHGYNVCADPQCAAYPFLSQVDFGIFLPDASKCQSFGDAILRSNPTPDTHVKYWLQRRVPAIGDYVPDPIENCTPGMRVDSGNFVKDATLYATCDKDQPFVFCPSPDTRGISLYNGMWACTPPSADVLEAGQSLRLFQNQVDTIEPLEPDTTLKVDGTPISLSSPQSLDGRECTIESDRPVRLKYRYTVTYPPQIVFRRGQATKYSMPFIMRGASGSTERPLAFPSHRVVDRVTEFDV